MVEHRTVAGAGDVAQDVDESLIRARCGDERPVQVVSGEQGRDEHLRRRLADDVVAVRGRARGNPIRGQHALVGGPQIVDGTDLARAENGQVGVGGLGEFAGRYTRPVRTTRPSVVR